MQGAKIAQTVKTASAQQTGIPDFRPFLRWSLQMSALRIQRTPYSKSAIAFPSLSAYKFKLSGDFLMSRRRITLAGLLAPLVASLLILGVVAVELPELVSLVDDTTNDFVVRKGGHTESTLTVTAPSQNLGSFQGKHFAPEAHQECAAGFVVPLVGSSELFLLHSVLRR
jgi:hypothetical protein